MKFRIQRAGRSLSAVAAALVAGSVFIAGAAPQRALADDPFDAIDDIADELFRDLAPAPRGDADETDGAEFADDPAADARDEAPPSRAIDDRGAAPLQLNPQDERHRILINMQLAQDQLAAGDASKRTQGLQRHAIDELQRLIEEAQSQQQPSPQSPSGQGGSAANQNRGEQEQSADQGEQESPEAGANDRQDDARDDGELSTERLGSTEAAEVEGERRHALVRQAWGHLPARLREQMQQRAVEEFLPQYEELIGDYFLRLAEENAGDP